MTCLWYICRSGPLSCKQASYFQGKVQKHQNFEAEVNANQARVDSVQKTGADLIEADHYAKDQVQ